MLFLDLLNIFWWWVIFFLIGLTFLPLTISLFKTFFDKGYIFSKILGILLISYTVWLLGSLKLLPFTYLNIFLIIALFLLINLALFKKNAGYSLSKAHLKIFAVEEALFTLGLFFWSYVKSFEPSIHGLEKYMDFGFINSVLRTEYLPPPDMWLAPFSINYYYFGHFVTALLIKISNIAPAITYNLMLAALFGLTLAASFSIGANLYYFFSSRSKTSSAILVLSGLLSAFLVTLGGNLHTIYAFFKDYLPPENPVPFWQLPFSFNFSSYWYPNATRFIPNTIHEFPIYSFVVSDLHGHVLNIPFVLLIIALLIKIFFSSIIHNSYLLILGLLIAVFLMTNVLDGPIYLLGIFLILLAKRLFINSSLKINFIQSLVIVSKQSAIILFLAIIFSLPFWLSFKPFGSGIGVLCAPKILTNVGSLGPLLFEVDHCSRSPFWMMMILWGFPYSLILGFTFYVFNFKFSSLKVVFKSCLSADRFKISNLKLRSNNPTNILIMVLIVFATILILIPEFVYVKDIYPAHYRANTVFKFGYQAFIILGLISGYMLTRLISNIKDQISKISYSIFLIFALCALILVSIYPYFAINSYFGGLKNYQGLDGLKYLSNPYPEDYQAILWLNKNIKGQPVILEAQGDSYTDYARVSSNTGLATVIGWPVHEWLWRGSYDEAGKRSDEVTEMYESTDINLTKELLKKYKVEYVFLGDLERQKYQNLNQEKFNQLGKVIFQSGTTQIFQISSPLY